MTVTLEKAENVATITIRRPEVKNALDVPTAQALATRIGEASADPEVRAILLTGEGDAFCSGVDLKAAIDPATMEDPRARIEDFHTITRNLLSAPQPVVTLVDGPAVGFGCNLALAADLVVATERAYFQLAFVRLGLVSDGGGTWMLPRRVGSARAMELLLLAERLPASQALAWGLVNRVLPAERAREEAKALCARLANGPARAYAALKRLVREGAAWTLEAALDAERDAQLEALTGPEVAEGIGAFLEKRDADFRRAVR